MAVKLEQIFQKNKEVTGKTPLFVVHFVVAILFVLTSDSDRVVLNGNELKNGTPVFWKGFPFPENLF